MFRLVILLLDRGIKFSFRWQFKWTGYKRMREWVYFKKEEVEGLDHELVSKLDSARRVAGVPFVITSGLRSQQDNSSALGVDGSAHLSGKAVDLSCTDSSSRMKMAWALLGAGFKRMGIYDRHIHVDVDQTKPQDIIWVGKSH